MVIFPNRAGQVIALQDEAIQQGTVSAPLFSSSEALGFQGERVLITRVALDEQTAHQFSNSLGGAIYLYVFGNLPGQLVISGIAVASCAASAKHGVDHAREWYLKNRLSKRKEPLFITIGSDQVVVGYLTGFNVDVANHEQRIMQFTMQLTTVPET